MLTGSGPSRSTCLPDLDNVPVYWPQGRYCLPAPGKVLFTGPRQGTVYRPREGTCLTASGFRYLFTHRPQGRYMLTGGGPSRRACLPDLDNVPVYRPQGRYCLPAPRKVLV